MSLERRFVDPVKMGERRLEDHIRSLCARLIETEEDDQEFQSLVTELLASLSEHIGRIRSKLKEYPVAVERRSLKG